MRFCTAAFATILLGLIPTQLAAAATYYVAPDGSGDFENIQAALAACGDGDTVLLEDGIYAGVGNRDLGFWGQGVTLRSISDDPELCIIDCQGRPEEPHRGFLFYYGDDSDAVVRGVTITNAWAPGG